MFSIDIKMTIAAPNIKEAYRKLYQEMKKIDRKNFGWESLDTWFNEGGDPISGRKIDDIIMEVIDGEDPGQPIQGKGKV